MYFHYKITQTILILYIIKKIEHEILFGECENYLITIWNENCIAVKVNVIPLGTQTHAAET